MKTLDFIDGKAGLLRSVDADAEVAQAQERYDLGVLDWTEIDASGTPENTLARAKAALASA